MAVGQDAHEGLGCTPDDVLNGNGQRKIGRGDADIANHVRLQQAKTLPHAHGQAQHHGGPAQDQNRVPARQIGLFHAAIILKYGLSQ